MSTQIINYYGYMFYVVLLGIRKMFGLYLNATIKVILNIYS